MATTTDPPTLTPAPPILRTDRDHGVLRKKPGPRRSRRAWLMVAGLMAVGITAVGVGASKLGSIGRSNADRQFTTHRVGRGDLLVTVTEDGNLESALNVDVKCQVLGGSTILWIVPDGSTVKKGEEIVRLDAATIEDQVNAQKILYEKAQAT